MMMKYTISRYCLLFVFLLGMIPQSILAQNISVKSFYLAENDLTAMDNPVLDQNGHKCALLRVQTTQKGFKFEVGSLSVKTVDETKVGEVWVYVPGKVKHIDIRHPQLGSLLGYNFDTEILPGRTYILDLLTDDITVKHAVTAQYVMFQVEPKHAVVELNGELLETIDGIASKRMPFGTYDYKVQAPRYAVQTGAVQVNDPKNKHVVTVTLAPQFSTFNFIVDGNAEIWIDDELKGRGTCSLELGYGNYLVETRLPGQRPSQVELTLTEASAAQPIQLNAPTPICGSLDINSRPGNADIWLDGKKIGTTPMLVDDVLVGAHAVKITKQGYNDFSQSVTVDDGQQSSVEVRLTKIPVKEQIAKKDETNDKKTEKTKDDKPQPVQPDLKPSVPTGYLAKNGCYIQPTFQVGSTMAVGALVGGYVSHVNLEAGFLLGLSGQDIYWNSVSGDAPRQETLRPSVISLRAGYGIHVGQRLRFTPQLGANIVSVKGDLSKSNATAFTIGCRAEYVLVKHLSLSLTPEYALPVMKSDTYQRLLDGGVKDFAGGFGVKAGVNIFF